MFPRIFVGTVETVEKELCASDGFVLVVQPSFIRLHSATAKQLASGPG